MLFRSWFNGIEVINGDHSDGEHGYLARHICELGLAAVAGSDAHTRQAVGRVATAFPGPVRDVQDIIRFIRAAATQVVDFRPLAHAAKHEGHFTRKEDAHAHRRSRETGPGSGGGE